MTTIAVNRSSMACDLQITYGGSRIMRTSTKIIEVPKEATQLLGTDRALIGFAGSADNWGKAVRWMHSPKGKIKLQDIEFVVLTKEGKIMQSNNLLDWVVVENSHFSIGSGSAYAMGAMSSGSSPKEAVYIASKHDALTGCGVKQFIL